MVFKYFFGGWVGGWLGGVAGEMGIKANLNSSWSWSWSWAWQKNTTNLAIMVNKETLHKSLVQKLLLPLNIMGPRDFWLNKIFVSQKIRASKLNLKYTINFGSISWVLIFLGRKKFLDHIDFCYKNDCSLYNTLYYYIYYYSLYHIFKNTN